MVERAEGTHPTAMASSFRGETIHVVTKHSLVVGFGVQDSVRDWGVSNLPNLWLGKGG